MYVVEVVEVVGCHFCLRICCGLWAGPPSFKLCLLGGMFSLLLLLLFVTLVWVDK